MRAVAALHLTPATRGSVESTRPARKHGQQPRCRIMSPSTPGMSRMFRASSQGQNTPSINISLHRSHRATRANAAWTAPQPPAAGMRQGMWFIASCRQSHQPCAQGKSTTHRAAACAWGQLSPVWPGCSHGAPSSHTSYHPCLGAPLLHLAHLQGPIVANLLIYTSHEWTWGSPTSPPCTYDFIPVSTSEMCRYCLMWLSLQMWAGCVFNFSSEIFAWAAGFFSAPLGRGVSFSHFSILSWSIEVSSKGQQRGSDILMLWLTLVKSYWCQYGYSCLLPPSLFNFCSFATLDDKQ